MQDDIFWCNRLYPDLTLMVSHHNIDRSEMVFTLPIDSIKSGPTPRNYQAKVTRGLYIMADIPRAFTYQVIPSNLIRAETLANIRCTDGSILNHVSISTKVQALPLLKRR